ncbi:hypothetical protein SLEP1_g55692 [Rubroshorea leprosula]|uniref:Retrotransposon gag domain-containing protein n=1 Tax=Rubroshorea leprosula TaxID=152421 RepID=A0AAV5MG31_9ROSI|nr:hypothetical protein SLEP1_g55692 [Rubroshorea leprosula]
MESARTIELEERTRVLEMATRKILSRLIPDDPLIPLLNRGEQPAAVVATRNSPALSNVVIPTRSRESGKLNPEPSSSRHNEELLKKNADLERQLKDVQKSIDELKSPRSRQQALDLDSAPLNLSIIAKPYQKGFKIPHWETYDGSGDLNEHLHTYQTIMRIQNATNAMMCKVIPVTLKSTARRWYHKLPRHSIASYSELATLFLNKFASQRKIKRTATELMQVHQKKGESLKDYMQQFNKSTLGIDNVPDSICLSTLLHGLKLGRFLDDLLENLPKWWNEVNDSGILPPSGTINMISGGMHSGGQSARGCKAYARQVMVVNKNRPLKRPFEEAEWENAPITFNPADYKRSEEELHVMMPHVDPFVTTVHIGNHNVNKVFIDTVSSPDILYWSYFQKMQLNPSSLRKYEWPIYGFDNQLVLVEGVITLGEEEPDVMMPHVDPFVATVHIGNYNVNKVFIDTGISPDILYWSCFQKMQLNPSSLRKYKEPIYGFDNQPIPVEGVITLPIYVGVEPRFRMVSVDFLVVKMESAFHAIIGRVTLCELKVVISQPHLCMKFLTLRV